MTTGEKIAKCRKDKNLTQIQLAEYLNVTRQAVSRWEGDLAFPETDNLVKMSRLFGVSCDWLLNYDSETSEPRSDGQSEPQKITVSFDLKKLCFEYKSKVRIGKLPLVHVNIGFGRTAKGFIAVGLASVGVVSVGIFSLGIFALGVLCLGVIGFASVSFGLVSFGGVAIGLIALGGVAVGVYSMGGCAVGLFAFGGYASGYYVAVGDAAVGGIALGKTSADGTQLSVLISQYDSMKERIWEKLDDIPRGWSLFTQWSRGIISRLA